VGHGDGSPEEKGAGGAREMGVERVQSGISKEGGSGRNGENYTTSCNTVNTRI